MDISPEVERRSSESSRRMSSLGGPMASSIVVWAFICVFVIAAIAMGAVGIQRSNDALALAQTNEAAIAANTQTMITLAVSQSQQSQQQQVETAPVLTNTNTGEVVTATTPPPTPTPTPEPSESPTETHPLRPEWFHISHKQYEAFADAHVNSDHHSHQIAWLFCMSQDRGMCPYEAYCPNGQGQPAYKGGPPKYGDFVGESPKQWAPYELSEGEDGLDPQTGGTWVQVGTVPMTDGGLDSNGHGSCWTWDDWTYNAGGDIEEDEIEDHRRWILCCANQFTPDP